MSYYKKVDKEIKKKTLNLRIFHNYIKSYLYGKYIQKNKSIILDLAAGKGGNIQKQQKIGAKHSILINSDEYAVEVAKNVKNKLNYSADILHLDLHKDITKDIEKVLKKNNIEGVDIVNIFFALHYFLDNKKSLNIIFNNINKYLLDDGYIIITALDGKKIFDLLKDKENIKFGNKDTTFVEIKKLYKGNKLENLGQKIDFYMLTIGKFHEENLVNFDYIIKYFENKGYKLIETDSFKNLLDKWYKKQKRKTGTVTQLSDLELTYTSLHRYLVMKK